MIRPGFISCGLEAPLNPHFDCNEPVHVRQEHRSCKFWIEPLNLCKNHGFSPPELTNIRNLIQGHLPIILEPWHSHCGE